MIEHRVGPESEGRMLGRYLRAVLPDVPLSAIHRMLRQGQVRVNGERGKPERRLAEGDLVQVLEVKWGASPVARSASYHGPPIRILFEDDKLLVLDKPAGLAVHGGTGLGGSTATDFLRVRLGGAADPAFRPSFAHRLDRPVSGVIVAGKDLAAQQSLAHQFREREIGKEYLALVSGRPRPLEGIIELPLAQRPGGGRRRQAVPDPAGQEARTRYRTLGSAGGLSLLALEPVTGRKHQLRAHLLAKSCPIVGDDVYGYPDLNQRLRKAWGLARLLLHCRSLELKHPGDARPMRFESDLPPDLDKALDILGIRLSKDVPGL